MRHQSIIVDEWSAASIDRTAGLANFLSQASWHALEASCHRERYGLRLRSHHHHAKSICPCRVVQASSPVSPLIKSSTRVCLSSRPGWEGRAQEGNRACLPTSERSHRLRHIMRLPGRRARASATATLLLLPLLVLLLALCVVDAFRIQPRYGAIRMALQQGEGQQDRRQAAGAPRPASLRVCRLRHPIPNRSSLLTTTTTLIDPFSLPLIPRSQRRSPSSRCDGAPSSSSSSCPPSASPPPKS